MESIAVLLALDLEAAVPRFEPSSEDPCERVAGDDCLPLALRRRRNLRFFRAVFLICSDVRRRLDV